MANQRNNWNVSTKFHGNPWNSCQDISLKAKNVNPMGVLEEMSGDDQS